MRRIRLGPFLCTLALIITCTFCDNNVALSQVQANPLDTAIKAKDVSTVEKLLKEGADPNRKVDDKSPAIIFAAENNHMAIVKALIKAKANVNAAEADGTTALMITTNPDIAALLIEAKGDVNGRGPSGMSPLMFMAQAGKGDMIQLLIKAKADVNQKDDEGVTALMLAASKHRAGTTQLLINNGADVNAQDESGMSALMYAAGMGADIAKHTDVTEKDKLAKDPKFVTIQELINRKADLNLKTKVGHTAATIASTRKFYNLAEFLVAEAATQAFARQPAK
jgi:hypothetical protein